MTLLEYVESRHDANLNELKEFLRIPSVSTKSEHKNDIERSGALGGGKTARRRA